MTNWARFALPFFALLWLGMIVANDVLPAPYYAGYSGTHDNLSQSVVTHVTPEAARSGLRVGDAIVYDWKSYLRRYQPKGASDEFQVKRTGTSLTLSVPLTVPTSAKLTVLELLTDLSTCAALVLIAYLSYRKPSAMMAGLILFIGGGVLNWPTFVANFATLPDWAFIPFGRVMFAFCDFFPVMALASFAIRVPGNAPSPAHRLVMRFVDAIVIAGFVFGFAYLPTAVDNRFYLPLTAFAVLLVVFSSVASLVFASKAERGRTAIVFAAIMLGGVGYAINLIGFRLGEPYWLFQVYIDISVLLVPFALAYAILRHRIFDVAFVLNRTIVFAVTSAIVLVVFAALEFGAERLLTDLTHVEGILLQFGIALFVIVSVRLLHERVDRAVDNVLFRTRHEQEHALRRFASTVQFYTEEEALVRDTVDVLVRYARVHGAAVYLENEQRMTLAKSSFSLAPEHVDFNDRAYVELRAHHEPLEVHSIPTAVPGDRVYPMIRAGRIVGLVSTGERDSGEEMPPDIDDAIKRIAHATAITLSGIESDRIRTELTDLRTRLGFS